MIYLFGVKSTLSVNYITKVKLKRVQKLSRQWLEKVNGCELDKAVNT